MFYYITINLCFTLPTFLKILFIIKKTDSDIKVTPIGFREKVFFVSERDKGDWSNLHVHMLLDTNTDMTYKEIRYGLGNISVGDYQIVYDQDEVCKYITKHIGKDVDYDFLIKS